MRLYEYEAKRLFRRYGIPVPESMVIDDNLWELENAVFPVVLKAQTLIGGRGKSGGIQFADNIEDAKKKIAELKKMKIKGYSVEKVLVERKMDIAKEYYVSATID
ncbi:MAG: ATP-grasp domain-containing protein, partial [Thermoplasmata archaeon]